LPAFNAIRQTEGGRTGRRFSFPADISWPHSCLFRGCGRGRRSSIEQEKSMIWRSPLPDGPDVLIWRYMNLPKFISLLKTRSLYFAVASSFVEDPWEGAHSRPQGGSSPYPQDHAYINCWHMGEHESYAMWKIYARDPESVAIVSTRRTLRNFLPRWIVSGEGKYIEYRKFGKGGQGIALPVKLEMICKTVFVNPYAPSWFGEIVVDVVDRYGLKVPVQQSSLSQPYPTSWSSWK
jgi:hypothetical protein